MGFDIDREPIDICRFSLNIPKGHSWGMCNEHSCPFWHIDLMEEYKNNHDTYEITIPEGE